MLVGGLALTGQGRRATRSFGGPVEMDATSLAITIVAMLAAADAAFEAAVRAIAIGQALAGPQMVHDGASGEGEGAEE